MRHYRTCDGPAEAEGEDGTNSSKTRTPAKGERKKCPSCHVTFPTSNGWFKRHINSG